MKKEEYIRKYGPAAWEERLSKTRRTRVKNKVDKGLKIKNESNKGNQTDQQESLRDQWKKENGAKFRSRLNECVLQERNKIRQAHHAKWGSADFDIHHEWSEDTADYRGVALVERTPHRHGVIKVVIPLEGVITNFARR
jgi:hypothetical protein